MIIDYYYLTGIHTIAKLQGWRHAMRTAPKKMAGIVFIHSVYIENGIYNGGNRKNQSVPNPPTSPYRLLESEFDSRIIKRDGKLC